MTGIELSRDFFREIVERLLAELAPGLRYSAALIGPGSEVLGYDDETSTDHHWGPRVQVFCSEADARSHRVRLTRELASLLPRSYAGYPTNSPRDAMLRTRSGSGEPSASSTRRSGSGRSSRRCSMRPTGSAVTQRSCRSGSVLRAVLAQEVR